MDVLHSFDVLLTSGLTGRINYWDLQTLELIGKTEKVDQFVTNLTQIDNQFLTMSSTKFLIWDIKNTKKRVEYDYFSSVNLITMLEDSQSISSHILVGGEVKNHESVGPFEGPGSRYQVILLPSNVCKLEDDISKGKNFTKISLEYSPSAVSDVGDGKIIITGQNRSIILFDLVRMKPIQEEYLDRPRYGFISYSKNVDCLDYDPISRNFACGCGKSMAIFNISENKNKIEGPVITPNINISNDLSSIRHIKDSQFQFIAGTSEGNLAFIDEKRGGNVQWKEAHEWVVRDILQVNDNIVTCSSDKTIKFWKFNKYKELNCEHIFTDLRPVMSMTYLEKKEVNEFYSDRQMIIDTKERTNELVEIYQDLGWNFFNILISNSIGSECNIKCTKTFLYLS